MPHFKMPDGEQLYVRIIGRGEPVLVLSGLGMQSWQWLPYLAMNLNKFQFIIPDWRGFGGSKNCAIPKDLNAIENHWRDVKTLIEQLKLDQFILMGYSMGATTSMHGFHYGDLASKIKAYLHIDQTPKISCDESWRYGLMGDKHPQFKQLLASLDDFLSQRVSIQYIDELSTQDHQDLTEMWLKFISLQASDNMTPKIFKLAFNTPKLKNHLLPIKRLDYLKWYISNYLNHTEDYREAIAKLNCSTTFFIGEQSTLYPSIGQIQIAESVQNSKYVLFKRSGHTPLTSEPIKFTQEISKFLRNSI